MGNVHEGHRVRLRKRFLTEGIDHFEHHQILELILFSVIPKQDTNELAHRLIQRFGSFSAVFDASVEELMTVPGIKEAAATYIKTFPAVFRIYEQDKNRLCDSYDTMEKLVKYARSLFVGVTCEQVYALMLNNRLQIEECFFVSSGTVNSSPVIPRLIMERVFVNKASCIVLVHNHPNGNPIASQNDIRITRIIDQACMIMGVNFLEHIIIAGDQHTTILHKSKGYQRPSPLTGAIDPDFYYAFYDNAEPNQ